ncbi:transmembrane protein 120B-like isoform X2 [Ptychodera flava]|uniref:transmembrane protein 120B-like isoform X2 n=1 Tax=Ptychodera flava TaxID=63121 RepID=UPI00396A256F
MMSNRQVTDCIDEWKSLEKEYSVLDADFEKYRQQLDDLYVLQERCVKMINHQKKRYQHLLDTFKDGIINGEEKKAVNEIEAQMNKRQNNFKQMEDNLPRDSGALFFFDRKLLTAILGPMSVSLLKKQDRFKYKDEYEKFKFICTIIMFVFSFTNLFLVEFRFSDALYHFVLLWYYCTVTLRETILRHNGSRIKGWWVFHHYISCVLSGVLLIWPDGPVYQLFRNQFMTFSLYLSLVQVLQYYYQRGCLYRLRALGEKGNMDITVEGFQTWMWRGLTFLLPFLFFGHFFQLYNAYTLYTLSYHDDCVEWQVPASALIFLALFFGNFSTTVLVVLQKVRNLNPKKPADKTN